MKEDEHILDKALEAIKTGRIPPGPSQELVDETLAKLAETQEQSETLPLGSKIGLVERLKTLRGGMKFAAAAVLLIFAGYAVGRISAPAPDMDQLQDALEPAIRRNVVAQLSSDLQMGLASLRNELDRQHHQDMGLVAAQTLAASNSVTNELLAGLIEAIDAAQSEDRQWVTAAIERIETDRLRDNAQLSTAFASFAMRTEDELQRTQLGMAELLSYGLGESSTARDFENSNVPDERRDK
jgi:ribosome assembly protein YihI (activator of Der GTPase)